tara:strand:- start:638 stop:856 length:219 start_codon:yes stop_codon:yes gene_type:complete
MVSDFNEEILNEAVHKVVWGDHKPKYEFLAEYIPGTMLDPETKWDPLEMLQFELMALNMRKQYGFDQPSEQD